MSLAAFGTGQNTKHQTRPKPARADKDFDLVLGCQKGERQAQFELYERYKDWVFNIAYRMANHQQEAEDITQKVFVQLFRKIGSFRGDSAFSSWLYRMAMNICINHFHSEKTRRQRMAGQLPDDENMSAKILQDKVEQFTLQPHLEHAIRQLPEGYRAVFILYDIEGYNHQEIARMRGTSIGTSKSQLHKARKELRLLLEPYLELKSL